MIAIRPSVLLLLLAGCSPRPPDDATPDAGPVDLPRPAFTATSSRLLFSDAEGTWSVRLGGAPVRLLADARKGEILPSPWLDRFAIVRPGAGTELYDADGRLLAWLATDDFAGWASNDTVIAAFTKWDLKGRRLRDYPLPEYGVAPQQARFQGGKHRVSPDGRWLAVTRQTMSYVGPETVFLATADGAFVRDADATGFWARDGAFVTAKSLKLKVFSADLTTTTESTLEREPCGGQAWIDPAKALFWGWHSISDYAICTAPWLVDLASGEAESLEHVLDGSRADSAFKRRISFAPGATRVAFVSREGGVGVTAPDGAVALSLAVGRPVHEVAWDSWNPRAPAHDPDSALATDPRTPPVVTATPPPGPPGTPPGSTDCRQGRWYRRTPTTLPTAWPSPRDALAGSFDRARGVLVVDGGLRVAAESSTWEWDGRTGTWTNRSSLRPPRPLPRLSHSFVYDAKRAVFVMLGGQIDTIGTDSSAIWEWDPVSGAWSELACALPFNESWRATWDPSRDRIWALSSFVQGQAITRDDCASTSFAGPVRGGVVVGFDLVTDTRRQRLNVLGGRSFGHGVHEWDGVAWTNREASTGAGNHVYAAHAFDEERGRLLSFSGFEAVADASGNLSLRHHAELWEWNADDATWTLCGAGPEAPPARTQAVMAWDPDRHALVLFGGTGVDAAGNPTTFNDVWEWAIP